MKALGSIYPAFPPVVSGIDMMGESAVCLPLSSSRKVFGCVPLSVLRSRDGDK